MGLDMFAYQTPVSNLKDKEKRVDIELIDNDNKSEIQYWRKHPNLHGWMEKLYRENKGKDEVFNCSSVLLTIEDLDELEKAVHEEQLPETEGFFFGKSFGEERQTDLEFINKARLAINTGNAVFYSSWW